jgi:hypothetical protein
VTPPQQRLEARDLVALKIEQRLVMDFELMERERFAQVELKRGAALHARVHLWLEEAIGAAAVLLGAIERHVSLLEQLVGVIAVARGCALFLAFFSISWTYSARQHAFRDTQNSFRQNFPRLFGAIVGAFVRQIGQKKKSRP